MYVNIIIAYYYSIDTLHLFSKTAQHIPNGIKYYIFIFYVINRESHNIYLFVHAVTKKKKVFCT